MVLVTCEGECGGLTNMARDRCLLGLAENGWSIARVYNWNRSWVSLGQFQRVSDALLPHTDIPWVRRPTGGRAVLHGHDVTVGMAVPLYGLRGLRQVYPVVIGLLADALRAAGAPAVLGAQLIGDRSPKLRSADCFAAVSPNDIVHSQTGQKICGCAMRLTESAVLVQASIPASAPKIDIRRVYDHPAPVHWIKLDPAALALALEAKLKENLRLKYYQSEEVRDGFEP